MFFRRRSVPVHVDSLTRELTSERTLAVARLVPESDVGAVLADQVEPLQTEATDWVTGTRNFLVVVRGDTATARPWCDVDRASMDPLTANLVVSWADGSPNSELLLADKRDPKLASVLHERVQASVILAETVRVPGGYQVRVAVRRGPSGELFSQVIGTGEVRMSDPATLAVIDAAEDRVRDACGLPL